MKTRKTSPSPLRRLRSLGALGGLIVLTLAGLFVPLVAFSAGTLSPSDGTPPLRITDHQVSVKIQNGFAQTRVTQTFANPFDRDLEAIYTFPAPPDATLAEVTIRSGEAVLTGEVVPREKARAVYAEETSAGREAGLAERDGYQQFRFHVYPVQAGASTEVTFVYYEPIRLDAGIGRYVYPLEEGGTDEAATSFWTRQDQVEGRLSFEVELLSAYPVADLRAPGREASARIERLNEGHWRLREVLPSGTLDRDFVLYYRLADDLPGRVELIPYKASPEASGTFMLVVTPGLDLQPLQAGADYVFVLDLSGSMQGKLHTLVNGVRQAIGQLRPEDRYRIVLFNGNASELHRGWKSATAEAVQATLRDLAKLQVGGGTNLEAAIHTALAGIDADRVTTMILVTDGVTNTGNVSPLAFHQLLKQHDLRFFAFLMGSSANFPLMEVLCDATGGHYTSVSNSDDIIGQILLAKNKVTHEALQNVEIAFESDTVSFGQFTGDAIGKIFRGQQLVLFGQYAGDGDAILDLKLRVSGEDRQLRIPLKLPAVDRDNPELERLWALQTVQDAEFSRSLGILPSDEAENLIRDLGVTYQIVTDETSMVILSDEAHARHQIDRRNAERLRTEATAQSQRATQPPVRYSQAQGGDLGHRAPGIAPSGGGGGSGGGAIDPFTALLALGGLGLGWHLRRRGRAEQV